MTYHDWVITQKAPDAGLSAEDVDDLYQHVAGVARSKASESDAREVLNWLVSVGPERARYALNEMRGRRWI